MNFVEEVGFGPTKTLGRRFHIEVSDNFTIWVSKEYVLQFLTSAAFSHFATPQYISNNFKIPGFNDKRFIVYCQEKPAYHS